MDISNIRMPTPPSYKVGDKIATRKAYGQALAKLGHASDRIIALDGDTKNSTFSDLFKRSTQTASSSATLPSRTW